MRLLPTPTLVMSGSWLRRKLITVIYVIRYGHTELAPGFGYTRVTKQISTK